MKQKIYLDLYKKMFLIREVEEQIAKKYHEQKKKQTLHSQATHSQSNKLNKKERQQPSPVAMRSYYLYFGLKLRLRLK